MDVAVHITLRTCICCTFLLTILNMIFYEKGFRVCFSTTTLWCFVLETKHILKHELPDLVRQIDELIAKASQNCLSKVCAAALASLSAFIITENASSQPHYLAASDAVSDIDDTERHPQEDQLQPLLECVLPSPRWSSSLFIKKKTENCVVQVAKYNKVL